MTKDAVATMENILPDDAGGRDAVHVAVFSAISSDKLKPGENITIISREAPDTIVGKGNKENSCAIVDPFLGRAIKPNERFWAYLYPRTITALSHRWSHPAFDEQNNEIYSTPAEQLEADQWILDYFESENWLQNFAEDADCPGYEEIMERARLIADGKRHPHDWDDEYMHFDGTDAHGKIPDEFWTHAEVVIGKRIPRDKRAKYFSCSC